MALKSTAFYILLVVIYLFVSVMFDSLCRRLESHSEVARAEAVVALVCFVNV